MKKIVKTEEVAGGLEALMGEKVLVWCMNYHYHGVLTGVNDTEILLTEAKVVYKTGPLCGALKNAQELPSDLYLRISAIECYYKHEG